MTNLFEKGVRLSYILKIMDEVLQHPLLERGCRQIPFAQIGEKYLHYLGMHARGGLGARRRV